MGEKMEVKNMTWNQYEEYMDLLAEQKAKVDKGEIPEHKMGFNLARWVLTTIYGIDLNKVNYSKALWELFDKTVALTEEREAEDEKNSEKSGIGESVVG